MEPEAYISVSESSTGLQTNVAGFNSSGRRDSSKSVTLRSYQVWAFISESGNGFSRKGLKSNGAPGEWKKMILPFLSLFNCTLVAA